MLPMVFTRCNKFRSFTQKNKYSVYFMLSTLSRRSFIKIQYSSFPLLPVAYSSRVATHYNITSSAKKCKLNDAIFPSGCEARAINLGNKNVKIGIFTGGTSVRSKNIFTDISRYPTGNHEINNCFIISLVLVLFIISWAFEARYTSRAHGGICCFGPL